ncbi:MAG: hypothetical protein JSR65_09440 [Proteobacteria bacterium]|nr:hypothetical protein [Pseudomonadota bacterium]
MNPRSLRFPTRRAQRGAVLFVALIFLVLLTLLGLTASGSSMLQERMTGGMRNGEMALMGAESGQRGAEFNLWIAAQTSAANSSLSLYCTYNGDGGCFLPDATNQYAASIGTFATTTTWPSAPAPTGVTTYATTLTGLTGASQSASLAAQPQSIVKLVGPDLPPGSIGHAGGSLLQQDGGPNNSTKYIYDIVARSPGGSANTMRAVESTFASVKASY